MNATFMSLEAVPLASPDAAPSVPGEVLLAHPGVAEAAVVGVPDRFWGEVVGAVLRPSGQALSQTDLIGYCRERLAGFKVPVRWLFTDAFPLTSTGKVRKDVLSAQLAGNDGAAGAEGIEGAVGAGKVPSSAT